MMQRDREFEQFVRRALHAAAESVAVKDDGLERIRGRLAEVRRAVAPDHAERAVPGPALLLVVGGRRGRRPGAAGNRLWSCVTAGSAGTRT
jgi:hypothetical protein